MISVRGDLENLKARLGPSPLDGIVDGIHHLQYVVGGGQAAPLVAEYATLTNFRPAGSFRHRATGRRYHVLRLAGAAVGIVIEEQPGPLAGFPRLAGLAFRCADLAAAERALAGSGVACRRSGMGIITDPIPGLDDRFAYTHGANYDWFSGADFEPLEPPAVTEPAPAHTVGEVDHIAYRIRADGVRAAAEWIMRLTPYRYSECYTVHGEKAETTVYRLGDRKPAIVISYGWDPESVVAKYAAKYGPRVHHTAYYTPGILPTVAGQRGRGLNFTTPEIIGSPARGLYQIFTAPSPYNHEITEYIERFGDFRGFFDAANVGDLMTSTRPFS